MLPLHFPLINCVYFPQGPLGPSGRSGAMGPKGVPVIISIPNQNQSSVPECSSNAFHLSLFCTSGCGFSLHWVVQRRLLPNNHQDGRRHSTNTPVKLLRLLHNSIFVTHFSCLFLFQPNAGSPLFLSFCLFWPSSAHSSDPFNIQDLYCHCFILSFSHSASSLSHFLAASLILLFFILSSYTSFWPLTITLFCFSCFFVPRPASIPLPFSSFLSSASQSFPLSHV